MEDCLFCKIRDGELNCHKVYEDDSILAFLDIQPLTRGHTLVIPKEHASSMYTFLRFSLPIGDVIDKENYPYTPIMLCKREKNYEVEKVLKYWEDNHSKIWKFSKSFSLLCGNT